MTKIAAYLTMALSVVAFISFASLLRENTEDVQAKANRVYTAIQERLASQLEDAELILRQLREDIDSAALRNVPSDQILDQYLQKHADVYDIFLKLTPDGKLLSSPTQTNTSIDLSHRDYYKRAVAKNDFAIGEFLVGKVSKLPVLAVALPVKSSNQEISYVLVTGIKTDWLKEVLEQVGKMDETLLIQIRDSSGMLLDNFEGNSISRLGQGRTVELVRLPLHRTSPDIKIVIYQQT
ncbi:PDC sensor domain-containing protein [Sneathiella glossodoripedis]|uniref:PDC sensor domain-containing protein n=1 Tax=Sneathiella glossodoripedis TaxID=418853 RepID=UPI000470C75B|nr:hypothetical protein [Sneathiella glossodoripedis]